MNAEIFIGNVGLMGGARSSEGDIGELDTVDVDLLVASFAGWRAAATAAGYERGSAFPGWSGMYVKSLNASQDGSGAVVTVSGHGVFDGEEKRKRTISCAGRQVSVGPVSKKVLVWSTEEEAEDAETGDSVEGKRQIDKLDEDGEVEWVTIATPSGTNPRWNIMEAILNVEDVYFATTEPDTTVGGTANTPPNPPTPPAYVWSGYDEPLRANHPNGWVMENRVPEEIVPGSLWRVTDRWAFYYADSPD